MNWLLRLINGCEHARVSFPITTKRRVTYVACLECGKEFSYSWSEMRMGPELGATLKVTELVEVSEFMGAK